MAQVIITFLRHGKTEKAVNDLDRQLTEEGVKQAAARRRALGEPVFDLVLASSADRAKSTAAIVAGINFCSVRGLDELYLPTDPADKKAVDDMFEKFAYAPLRAYREADTTEALVRYGATAAKAILNEIQRTEVENVLVGGHAVLIPSIIAHMLGTDTDLVLDANLGEVEGIRVTLDENAHVIDVELVQ